MRPLFAALAVTGIAVLAVHAQAPAPAELDELVDRVADYVAAYTRDFVGIVAEESYRQQYQRRGGSDARGFPTEGQRQSRQLRSDMLLVRAPAGDRWLQFRDVFEVDGRPVRDRAERVAKLFLQPSPSAQRQVDDIQRESARYNIGGVNRTINLPVLALSVVDLENRPWFSFAIGRKKDKVWELEFREQRTGTLIRTTGDSALPVHGKLTVDAPSGRVLATELQADNRELKAEIDVSYVPDPAVGGMLVPREMREKYELKDGSTVDGRATYANFRRFTVTTDEKLKK